jgi:hypothetical protein
VAAGLAPALSSTSIEAESSARQVKVDPKDRVLWFDALHFTEWGTIHDAARVLSRSYTSWAWTMPIGRADEPLEFALDHVPDDAQRIQLPHGDRSGIELGALMQLRKRMIEDELLTAADDPHRIWIVATAGLVYLGHGLRRDVGDGQGDRADAARAAWVAAFPTGRSGATGAALPSRLREPTRTIDGRRYPVGRLAWPDAPGTTWLQTGGLSLPERVQCLFRLDPEGAQ